MAVTRPFKVGDWTAEPDLDRITRGDERTHLRPQVMRLLVYLSERQGEVVYSADLMHDLWSGKIVTDATIYNCVSELRSVLNGAKDGQEAIQTIPKKGYRLTLPVCGINPPEPQPARDEHSRRRVTVVVLAALVAAVAVWLWSATPPERSIAVLAFDNMSADPEQEYFADGISEEILNRLAQIESLVVIARQSSFFFKGKDVDITTIAKQLGVRHIVEGSVRRSGDRVRITAQLIDAKDSSHLWSETYDRDFSAESLIEIQIDIARAITRRLRATLTGDEQERLARVPTKNTEAYAAYLLGRDRLRDRKVAELRDAVGQFARAIELDPKFADAYSGLVDACLIYGGFSGGYVHEACPPDAPEAEIYASLTALVDKALELDDRSGEAWITRGSLIQDQVKGDLASMPKLREAHAAYERGLELSPSHSQGYLWYATSLPYIMLYDDPPHGWIEAWRQDTWQSVARRGLEVDPLSVPLHTLLSSYGIWARDLDEAYQHAHRIVEIAPDSPLGYARLGNLSQRESGRMDEAIKWRLRAARADNENPNYLFAIGDAYAALGDLDMALAYLSAGRRITRTDADGRQHDILMDEAAAWLGSRRDDAAANARERLARSEIYDAERLEIELALDSSAIRKQELLNRYKEQNADADCFTDDADFEGASCPVVVHYLYGELIDAETAKRRLEILFEGQNTISVWSRKALGPHLLRDLTILGRYDEALDLLEELVQSGWRGAGDLRFDLYRNVLFDAIRDHPRFQAVVAVIESDMAEQLENVRAMEQRGELPTLQEVQAGLIVDLD